MTLTNTSKLVDMNWVIYASILMCVAVVASNILVQFPFTYFGLGELLTWGALSYPFAFLINDLTNRKQGPSAARLVVYAGFILGAITSFFVATPRIAIASSIAFLTAQLMDISVFDKLRKKTWWKAPFAAAVIGSAVDTLIFFCLAFAGIFSWVDVLFGMPVLSLLEVTYFGIPLWLSLAFGDFIVKVVFGTLMLAPYRVAINYFIPKDVKN